MTHLGADVAAYVDGQLPPEREEAARRHVETCERCRALVVGQRQVKRRVTATASVEVPAHLAATLAAVGQDAFAGRPEEERRRLRAAVGAAAAVFGSAAAVVLAAYVLAPPPPRDGDPVSPDFDAYAAGFVEESQVRRTVAAMTVSASTSVPSAASTQMTAASTDEPVLSAAELDRLADHGWPCHERIAGGLERTKGRLIDHETAVELRYADEHLRAHLVEQVGSLDETAVEGFDRQTVSGAHVWVREGQPTIVAWDADGVVYTLVTNASSQRIAEAVEELPSTPVRSTASRVGEGLVRMADWWPVG
ncbi:MAG: zf-HC2 domain-containing protein [Aeromicrobium sp.]|uniref:anti-sigma factor family protein n=1 Tax=Aeromicrobium sp. TaxID=1871063 RepID=UPI0039E26988